MKKIIVAIDGHSGCGKSSTAKAVARNLDFLYIDSGAMYRAATLFYIRMGIDWENVEQLEESVNQLEVNFRKNEDGSFTTLLNGENVEDEIRSLEIGSKVSKYSTIPVLRSAMVALQRKLSQDNNVVMDGRDIGTVVFPDADLKIFMTADLDVRALRRQQELSLQGKNVSLEEVIEDLKSRDEMDTKREISPLKQASDAIVVDTTHLTLDEQIQEVTKMAQDKQRELSK